MNPIIPLGVPGSSLNRFILRMGEFYHINFILDVILQDLFGELAIGNWNKAQRQFPIGV